jgi:hypothetical protein
LRELIHKQANCLQDIHKVFPGDLTSRVVLTYDCHPSALLSGPGITNMPTLSGSLGLPALGSAPGQQL